jgi:hypothetical protein
VEDAEDRSLLGMLAQALGKSKDNFTFDTGPVETAESAELRPSDESRTMSNS